MNCSTIKLNYYIFRSEHVSFYCYLFIHISFNTRHNIISIKFFFSPAVWKTFIGMVVKQTVWLKHNTLLNALVIHNEQLFWIKNIKWARIYVFSPIFVHSVFIFSPPPLIKVKDKDSKWWQLWHRIHYNTTSSSLSPPPLLFNSRILVIKTGRFPHTTLDLSIFLPFFLSSFSMYISLT